MQVAPPPNGKKLWRVKRASCSSASGPMANSSLECLNNSLRISAAGKTFLQKRAPAKRPRSKPGMPKDFVFVDLSPIKTSSSDDELVSSSCNSDFSPISAALSVSSSPSSMSRNDSISTMTSFDAEIDQAAISTDNTFNDCDLLGLGLLNLNYDFNASQPIQSQDPLEMLLQTLPNAQENVNYYNTLPDNGTQVPETPLLSSLQLQTLYPIGEQTHKRAHSMSSGPRRKSMTGLHFKSYNGPKKIQKVHKRCFSESHVTQVPTNTTSQQFQTTHSNAYQSMPMVRPLASQDEKEFDLNAFISELEQEELCLLSTKNTQTWNDSMALLELPHIGDIPEYSEIPSMIYDFDVPAFTAY